MGGGYNPGVGQAVVLGWTGPAQALGYNIYGSSDGTGVEAYLIGSVMGAANTSFTSWWQPGSIGGLQGLPLIDTTGSPLIGLPDEGWFLTYGTGAKGSRYVTRWSEASNRAQIIPTGIMNYDSYAAYRPVPEGLTRIQQAVSLRYTHHMVDVNCVPHLALLNTQGFLNDRPFDGWPRGTLLLEGVEPRYYRSGVGNRVVDLTYSMTALPNVDRYGYPQGHNAVFGYLGGPGDTPFLASSTYPRLADYVVLNSDGSGLWAGTGLFGFANYTKLFRPDQP